jgi:hypothetical protein
MSSHAYFNGITLHDGLAEFAQALDAHHDYVYRRIRRVKSMQRRLKNHDMRINSILDISDTILRRIDTFKSRWSYVLGQDANAGRSWISRERRKLQAEIEEVEGLRVDCLLLDDQLA